MNKKLLLALIIFLSAFAWWLLRPSTQSEMIIHFKDGHSYIYQFQIEQKNTQNQILGGEVSIILSGTLDIQSNKNLKITLTSIDDNSKIKILKKALPIKETLEGRSAVFSFSQTGQVDKLYFENATDPTIQEILKNMLSLFNWSFSDEISQERINSGIFDVEYQRINRKRIKKEILTPITLGGISFQNLAPITEGLFHLELEDLIPQKIWGGYKIEMDNYLSTFKFSIKRLETKTSLNEIVMPSNSPVPFKTINQKKIPRKKALESLASGLSTQDILSLIEGGSAPKDWFAKAKARLLLDSNSHNILKKQFFKTTDIEKQMVIMDLLATAGVGRFQVAMVSILNRYEDHPNYQQAVQRLSLLNSPTNEVYDYLKLETASKVLGRDKKYDSTDRALLYTYGSLARSLDQKRHDEIVEEITEKLDEGKNQSDLLIALANTGNPNAPQIIESYSNSDNPQVRESSVTALGTLSTPTSKEALLTLSFDRTSTVANRAIRELRKFSLDKSDFEWIKQKIGNSFPEELWVANLLGILSSRAPEKTSILTNTLYRFHQEGTYTSKTKRRILGILEIIEAS